MANFSAAAEVSYDKASKHSCLWWISYMTSTQKGKSRNAADLRTNGTDFADRDDGGVGEKTKIMWMSFMEAAFPLVASPVGKIHSAIKGASFVIPVRRRGRVGRTKLH